MLMIATTLGAAGVLLAVARVWLCWPRWLIAILALVVAGSVIIGNDWYQSRQYWLDEVSSLRAMMENKTIVEVEEAPDGHKIYVVQGPYGETEDLHEYPFRYEMRRGEELFLAIEMAIAFAAILAVVVVSTLLFAAGRRLGGRGRVTA